MPLTGGRFREGADALLLQHLSEGKAWGAQADLIVVALVRVRFWCSQNKHINEKQEANIIPPCAFVFLL